MAALSADATQDRISYSGFMAATARALARLKQRGHALHQEFHLSASPSADLEVRRTGLLLSGNGYYQMEYFLLNYTISVLKQIFPLPNICGI